MTTDTTATDAHMIEISQTPTGRVVAGLAVVVTFDVIGAFAHRRKGVMTAHATTGDVGMGKVSRPTAGAVATLTVVATGDVQGAFANGHRTIMTTETRPFNIIVINFTAHTPREGVMAGLAIAATVDVPF